MSEDRNNLPDQPSWVVKPRDAQLPDRDYELQIQLSLAAGDTTDAGPLPVAELAQLALWCLAQLQVSEPAELSLSFVEAEAIRVLNRDYRGVDKATDVLSFPVGWDEDELLPAGQPLILGDIVICPEIAARVAASHELNFDQMLRVLVVHGILHLLGYDHEQSADAVQMEAQEDALFAAWQDWQQAHQSLTEPQLAPLADFSARPIAPASWPAEPRPSAAGEQPTAMTAEASQTYQPAQPSLVAKFRWAGEGFLATVRTQPNMRIHLAVAALAVFAAIILGLSPGEWGLIIICILLVLAAEMLNTAIEAVVDLASPQIQPKAKLAKDIAAGVVLLLALGAVVVGLLIFIPAGLRRWF
ncbi:MAG: rRNA maturation RNase YbeY [Actinomycetia bacterium]|nr:rRNA maturation RNase YbeY [Actinomycetes bacterium]